MWKNSLLELYFIYCLGAKLLTVVSQESSQCSNYLVSGSDRVPDYKITASSQWNDRHIPIYARINSQLGSNWCPNAADKSKEYIQVELNALSRVTGILTQGRWNSEERVTRYAVEYSADGEQWQFVTNGNSEQAFPGNSDRNTPKVNTLARPIDAKFVRIYTRQWTGNPCLRFDVLGCELGGLIAVPETWKLKVCPDPSNTPSTLLEYLIGIDGTVGYRTQDLSQSEQRNDGCFEITFSSTIGIPNLITIRPGSNSKIADWKLSYVTLQMTGSEQVFRFDCDCLINAQSTSFSTTSYQIPNWFAAIQTGQKDGEETMSSITIAIHDVNGLKHTQRASGTFEKGAMDVSPFQAEMVSPSRIDVSATVVVYDTWTLNSIDLYQPSSCIVYRFTCDCSLYRNPVTLSLSKVVLCESTSSTQMSYLTTAADSNSDGPLTTVTSEEFVFSTYPAIITTSEAEGLKSTISTEITENNVLEAINQYLQWGSANDDTMPVLLRGEYIASYLNGLEIQNRTKYVIDVLPKRWSNGLLDVGLDCNDTYNFTQLLENVLQQPRDKNLDFIMQALDNISSIMTNSLYKGYPHSSGNFKIATKAFATIVADSERVSKVAINNVVDASLFLVEAFLRSLNKTDSTAAAMDAVGSLMNLCGALLNVLSPDNLMDMHEALVSDDTESSRMYVDFMILVHIDQAFDLIECSQLTPDERTGIFKLQSKVYQLQFKTKQDLANEHTKTVLTTLQSMVEQVALRTLCSSCNYSIDTSAISVTMMKISFPTSVHLRCTDVHVAGIVPNTDNITDILIMITVFLRNPMIMGQSTKSSLVTSHVVKLKLTDLLNNVIETKSVTVSFPLSSEISGSFSPQFTPGDASKCIYHILMYRNTDDEICMHLSSIGYTNISSYEVYIRHGRYPTHLRFDISSKISPLNNWTTCVKPTFPVGVVYVCLRPMLLTEMETTSSSVGNVNVTDPLSPYNLTLVTTSCQSYSITSETWKADTRCKMTWLPSENRLRCICENLEEKEVILGNTFYVPASTISFSTAFLKFSPKDQASVIGVIAAILIIYLLLCIWGRIQDRKDIVKWGATPLLDNYTDDTYYYLITVHTGMRIGAGTKSSVEFVAVGDKGDTCVRKLSDGVRKEFKRGSVMHFIMATPHPLGELDYVYLWLTQRDGQAVDPWYLHRIDLQDLQIHRRYVMYCNKWLADKSSPNCMQAVLPVCGREDVLAFQNLFFNNIFETLAENHMFLSIFYRPTSSNFTRVQRTTCLLVFVAMTMIGNAIYFTPADEYVDPEQLTLGPLVLSLQIVYVSLVSSVISTTTTFLVSILFRKSKPRPSDYDVNKSSLEYIVPSVKGGFCWLLRESKELEKHLITKGLVHTDGLVFPFWFIYVAWLISLSGTAVAMFFLLLYSMEWGKHKSEMWLTQFFLSFGETCVVLDQIKVPIIAAVLAMMFIPFHQFRPSPMTRSMVLKHYRQMDNDHTSSCKRKPGPGIDKETLKSVLLMHEDKQQIFKSLRDFLLLCIFLWIVSTIIYGNRDPKSFNIQDNIKNYLVNPKDGNNFDKIKTVEDYNGWFSEVMLTAAFPENDSYGKPLHWRWRQYFTDFCTYRIGPPRIRQLRVHKEITKYPYFGEVQYYPSYTVLEESTTDSCKGWQKPPCDATDETYSFSTDAWQYTSALAIWGMPVAGLYSIYGGGGYIAEFDVNRLITEKIWNELISNRWIDRSTRALMLEFTVYFANLNIFTYVTFHVEVPETGGIITSYFIYPFKIYPHHGKNAIQIIVCEILFVIAVAILFIHVTVDIYNKRTLYLHSFTQILESTILLTCITSVAMYVLRYVAAGKTMKQYTKHPETFVNFQQLVVIDIMFILFLSVSQALLAIRLCCAIGIFKNVKKMLNTFRKCLKNLYWFSLGFWYVIIGFSFLGTLILGKDLKAYMNTLNALESLVICLIGKTTFVEMNNDSDSMAKLYFFVFVMVQYFLFLTVYLAILCESFTKTTADSAQENSSNLLEIIYSYLFGLFHHKTGTQSYKLQTQKPKTLIKHLRDFCHSELLRIKTEPRVKVRSKCRGRK